MVDQYIAYVQETIKKFQNYAKVIDREQDAITPALIMECMANYGNVVLMLNAEYQRNKISYNHAKMQFDVWYDEKLIATKNRLMAAEGTGKYKISLKEIEAQLKVDNRAEYVAQMEDLIRREHEVAFLRRLREDWQMVGQMYLGMSNNMRQEMRSFTLTNAVNRGDTNLRTEYPAEQSVVGRRRVVNVDAGQTG